MKDRFLRKALRETPIRISEPGNQIYPVKGRTFVQSQRFDGAAFGIRLRDHDTGRSCVAQRRSGGNPQAQGAIAQNEAVNASRYLVRAI